MWRYTHDRKYREWGWRIFQSFDKLCRGEHGFSGLLDSQDPCTKDNEQQSWFLAETLKYLYLLFCEDDVISLDKYVLTTEAHPLLLIESTVDAALHEGAAAYKAG